MLNKQKPLHWTGTRNFIYWGQVVWSLTGYLLQKQRILWPRRFLFPSFSLSLCGLIFACLTFRAHTRLELRGYFLLLPQKLRHEGGAECSFICCSSSLNPKCRRGAGIAGRGAKLFLSASSLRAELQASVHSWFVNDRPWPPHLWARGSSVV